jgi:sortase (surface protein transpeptidase)
MRRRSLVAIAAGAALALAATAGAVLALDRDEPAPSASPTSTPTPGPLDAGGLQDPQAAAEAPADAQAVRVRVPSLGIDSTLETLAIDGSTGELLPPVDYGKAGWYADGVVPGRVGPAIIAGHVDSAIGGAVFERLGELRPGDEILVDLSTGDELRFVMRDSAQSTKATFPTSDVYGNVPTPQLRLITCAGTFDRSIGHYTDNLIVFADLVR